jgi:hypothetical protein
MLSSNTVLIAGASAGVGTVDADLLARRDHDLVMVARDEARLQSLMERIRKTPGWRVEALRADLTRKENLPGIKQTLRRDPIHRSFGDQRGDRCRPHPSR